MKKMLLSILISVVSATILMGCTSDTETVIGDSVLSETTEEISEETPVVSEEVATSEETSIEEVEEVVMYSADEVMAHIDSLITQYQYNDPEHIKALVIAANMDYISEDDLNTILSTYGYTMEELAVKYDECILDNGESNMSSFEYYQGNIEALSEDKDYENRISLNKVMLNDEEKELAKWYDTLLYGAGKADTNNEQLGEFLAQLESIETDLPNSKRMIYTYTVSVYANDIIYTDYLENPYMYYINSH